MSSARKSERAHCVEAIYVTTQLSVLRMRSKAWLAARVSLRLVRLRSTRTLTSHKNISYFLQWVQHVCTRRYHAGALWFTTQMPVIG